MCFRINCASLQGLTSHFLKKEQNHCTLVPRTLSCKSTHNILLIALDPKGAESDPPPHLRVAKAGRIHLKEEITPLLPTGIGENSDIPAGDGKIANLILQCSSWKSISSQLGSSCQGTCTVRKRQAGPSRTKSHLPSRQPSGPPCWVSSLVFGLIAAP
jgi:hypothetical protein